MKAPLSIIISTRNAQHRSKGSFMDPVNPRANGPIAPQLPSSTPPRTPPQARIPPALAGGVHSPPTAPTTPPDAALRSFEHTPPRPRRAVHPRVSQAARRAVHSAAAALNAVLALDAEALASPQTPLTPAGPDQGVLDAPAHTLLSESIGQLERLVILPNAVSRSAEPYDARAHLGVFANLRALPLGLRTGGALRIEGLTLPPVQAPLSTEQQGIDAALADVARWHQNLPIARATWLKHSDRQAYTCPISHAPFAELNYPVGVQTGGVLHIYEAHDLLIWMQRSAAHSVGLPGATNPLDRSPLRLGALSRIELEP